MGEPVGEVAVVREQQHAARVDVEPADGDDRASWPTRSTTVGRPSRIARRRDDAERLVEQDVRQLLLADPLAVDLDDVARGDEGVQLPAPAVDGDPARLDQLVGRAARGDAGAGEVSVEAHGAIVATLPALCATTRDWTRKPRRPDRRLRRERAAGPARRRHELRRQGRAHPRDRPRRVRARRPVRRRRLLGPVGQAPAAARTAIRRRSTTSRRGCATACSTSPTSTPRGSR